MIRARFIKVNGVYEISLAGHAQADVCCGAGMIMQAAMLGLRDLAKQYPKEIMVEAYAADGPQKYVSAAWTDNLDSTDQRKKPTRR